MAPRRLFEKRPLLENPPSASPSEEEEENPDQQPRKETQESEFFSVGEGEREEEKEQEEVEVAKNTTTEEGEEEEEEEINNTTALKEEEEKPGCGGAGNRLWSEDDEITILEGMINYHSKKGADPYTELGEFHEFIKNSLNVDASNSQFVDKVRKMKVKYNKNLKKGEGAVSKPHDLKCFELSKKIWAVGGGGKQKRNGVNGNGKRRSKRARKTVEKAGYSWGIHPCLKQSLARETETFSFDLSMNEPLKSFMMANMSMIGKVKVKELKKKKKDLLVDEVAMYLRRVELVKEGTELMLEAMKASKD